MAEAAQAWGGWEQIGPESQGCRVTRGGGKGFGAALSVVGAWEPHHVHTVSWTVPHTHPSIATVRQQITATTVTCSHPRLCIAGSHLIAQSHTSSLGNTGSPENHCSWPAETAAQPHKYPVAHTTVCQSPTHSLTGCGLAARYRLLLGLTAVPHSHTHKGKCITCELDPDTHRHRQAGPRQPLGAARRSKAHQEPHTTTKPVVVACKPPTEPQVPAGSLWPSLTALRSQAHRHRDSAAASHAVLR